MEMMGKDVKGELFLSIAFAISWSDFSIQFASCVQGTGDYSDWQVIYDDWVGGYILQITWNCW